MTYTDEQVERVATSYFEKIRTLPAPDAARLLNALLDKMWCNGAQAGQPERDEVQAAYFERHLSERRREANATIAAIAALPPQGDGLAELRVGDFVMRTSPNGIWIGRTDGEGGEFATEHVERVIAQFYREQF